MIAVVVIGAIGIVYITGNVVDGDYEERDNQQTCRDVESSYEEQEEYLKTEYYTETVPYEDDVPLEYQDSAGDVWGLGCGTLTNYMECYWIDIINLDTIGGTFTVDCDFETLYRNLYDTRSQYVKPGDTERFECKVDIDWGEDVKLTWSVNPPTKSVTKYEEVQRERQVTAYRPVTMYKTETICD